MSKKRITIAIAVIIVMVFACKLLYNQTISNEYVPADDEIALHIQLDTKEGNNRMKAEGFLLISRRKTPVIFELEK